LLPQLKEKTVWLRQYLADFPLDKKALTLLAGLELLQKNYAAALSAARKAFSSDTADSELLQVYAEALLGLDQAAAALDLLETERKHFPGNPNILLLLARAYEELGRLREAAAILKEAFEATATITAATGLRCHIQGELGGIYCRIGKNQQAAAAFLAASNEPADPQERLAAYSSYLMCTNYQLSLSTAAELLAHRQYNALLPPLIPYLHQHHRLGRKKLRIGYLSADFYHHVMAYFLFPLLHCWDHNTFEIFCYQRNEFSDDATEQLQAGGAIWRNIAGLSAQLAAKQIYEDEIDILVELGGHTAENALEILAYKPAPLQLCGIGYINTTGLAATDYFLTDCHIDPPGENDHCFSEQLLRLKHSQWCYAPRIDAPACQMAPVIKNGFITFACFNNYAKLTDEMLRLWKELLQQLPQAKLILKNKFFLTPSGCQQATARFEKLGLNMKQIELRPASKTHLAEYLETDIALDTYPYVGGATTCDALYMGIPVITLAGSRHRTRFGLSMLKNVGLENCLAKTPDEYLGKAITLSTDTHYLNELHQGLLRKNMLASPLMNPILYMKDLEAAYQQIWHKFCTSS
jgi:predicted O-linked N-acetylglucosamine transferase (SPINDLY family)